MRLAKINIKNFRGFRNQTVDFTNFTTLVGINDSGKSTILEALDIFFGNSKIEKNDRNVYSDAPVEFTAYFDNLPNSFTLETIPTTLKEEYLINYEDNREYLTINQVYKGDSLKKFEYLICDFPKKASVQDIHTMKIKDLRNNFSEVLDDVDGRKSTEIRKAALKLAFKQNNELQETKIDLNGKEALKDISSAIHSNLPIYQLFKADRNNTDNDSEIQDPIKAIVKSAIAEDPEIQKNLSDVSEKVENAVATTTSRTLKMLQEMNTSLAKDIIAEFQKPKWDSLFKFSLDTESGIPLNKRGSGVRRLILLNFFRSEAQRRIEQAEKNLNKEINIIYAFEEPETAQHPKFQKMLIDSFQTMSETKYVQVMITTHSPAIAQIVPAKGIKLIRKNDKGANVFSGNSAVTKVIDELGIVPNVKLYPDQIKRAVVVEGPTDATFFYTIYNLISNKSTSEKKSTIFISGGGGAIVDLINSKFIEQLNVNKKFMIVDGDNAGSDDKKRAFTQNNGKVLQLKKATIEFYLPYKKVKSLLSQNPQCNLTTTSADWSKGDDKNKLKPGQKRILKDQNIYGNLAFDDLTDDVQAEMKDIIQLIDED